jgi:hypothetical protein
MPDTPKPRRQQEKPERVSRISASALSCLTASPYPGRTRRPGSRPPSCACTRAMIPCNSAIRSLAILVQSGRPATGSLPVAAEKPPELHGDQDDAQDEENDLQG